MLAKKQGRAHTPRRLPAPSGSFMRSHGLNSGGAGERAGLVWRVGKAYSINVGGYGGWVGGVRCGQWWLRAVEGGGRVEQRP